MKNTAAEQRSIEENTYALGPRIGQGGGMGEVYAAKANRWEDMRSQSRETTFPEEVLCAGFLKPFGVTPEGLAERLGASIEVAYEMMVGTRAITQEMAVGLASVFKTSPEFWVTIQQGRDRTRS